MGATWIGGTYTALDWRTGIDRIQLEAENYYGYQDGYSGGANSCNFGYGGGCYDMKAKDVAKYIEKRKDVLGSGEGEVLEGEIVKYAIITTDIKEERFVPLDVQNCIKSMKKGPAVLVNPRWYPAGEGTVAELKKRVHTLLRDENYMYDYYIITKSKKYICTGKIKYQKSTQRKSDDKYLVLPIRKYIYYGWARE